MLKPDIPADQLEKIRPVLDPLLARLRAQTEKLPPQAESALAFALGAAERGDGQ
jgi:hypothetical protein